MTVAELLTDLYRRRVVLDVNGERLRVDAPKGILTPELRQALAKHKAKLVTYLEGLSDGRCTVHGRWLTYAEQQAGRCSWCYPEDREWSDEDLAAIARLNAKHPSVSDLPCLDCRGRLSPGTKYYCDACLARRGVEVSVP
jgi:hypothetical protein